MANLIITVIAIALVAVASLMGAYYGGSAFLNNQSSAGASTVLNAGQQIAGAWQSYLAANYNTPPTDFILLTGGTGGTASPQYLANIPNYPAAAGGVVAAPMAVYVSASHYYALADVGIAGSGGASISDGNATGCLKIIKAAIGTNATTVTGLSASAIVSTATNGNNTFGCSVWTPGTDSKLGSTTTITSGHYVMAYKLS